MKKRIGYLALLLAFLLIGCTFLSHRVEEIMMTQAVVRHFEGSNITISGRALFDSVLYDVEEGLGWNTGLRASEVSPTAYERMSDGSLMMDYGTIDVIYTASRVPVPGEQVNRIVTDRKGNRETAPDQYLVIYCDGVPQKHDIPEELFLVKRNENVMLLEAAESPMPFLEHEAKGKFSMIWGMEWRIFSMTDLEQLAGSLPLIALAAVLAVIPPVLFLVGLCLPPLDGGKDPVLRLQLAVGLSFLAGFVWVLYAIRLPASLVPVDMVFQWDHYTYHVQTALNALELLEEPGLAQLLAQSRTNALLILAGSVLLLTILLVFSIVLHLKTKRKHVF